MTSSFLVMLAGGCSREQQDWHSAEAADTIGSYARFMQRHPESELVTQARARIGQLEEDRDWEAAGSVDTDGGLSPVSRAVPGRQVGTGGAHSHRELLVGGSAGNVRALTERCSRRTTPGKLDRPVSACSER